MTSHTKPWSVWPHLLSSTLSLHCATLVVCVTGWKLWNVQRDCAWVSLLGKHELAWQSGESEVQNREFVDLIVEGERRSHHQELLLWKCIAGTCDQREPTSYWVIILDIHVCNWTLPPLDNYSFVNNGSQIERDNEWRRPSTLAARVKCLICGWLGGERGRNAE